MLLYMWNVDGLDQTKGAKIKDDINRYSPDMVIILETKKKLFQVETLLDLIDRDDQYHHLINSHSPGNIHGIAVMVSKKVHQFMDFRSLADQPFKLRCSPRKETLSHIKDATCGRVLAVEISLPPHPPIVVVATYNPNSGADPRFPLKNLDYRINQWDPAMYQGLMELQGKYSHIIWCGDFNVAPHEIDVSDPETFVGVSGCTTEERANHNDFLERSQWVDIWRKLHPTTKGFTHRDVTDHSRQLRLDSYVVSPDVIPLVVACDILSSEDHLESDHIPVTLTLAE